MRQRYPSMSENTETGVLIDPPDTSGLSDTAARELLQFHLGRAIAHAEAEGAMRKRVEWEKQELRQRFDQLEIAHEELRKDIARELKRLGPMTWGEDQIVLDVRQRVDPLMANDYCFEAIHGFAHQRGEDVTRMFPTCPTCLVLLDAALEGLPDPFEVRKEAQR